MQKDVVIIGAGPAGIFTALEMLKKGGKQKILIVEKGATVENRRCPKSKAGKCVMPYHYRFLRRRCVFRWQTVTQL